MTTTKLSPLTAFNSLYSYKPTLNLSKLQNCKKGGFYLITPTKSIEITEQLWKTFQILLLLLLKIQRITFDISNILRRSTFLTFLKKNLTNMLCAHLHICPWKTVWGSLGLLSLILSYPITVVLCWITGLRVPPNNRVHHEICSRPILWTDTWYLNSSYHCHLSCMALINCKYRWFFFLLQITHMALSHLNRFRESKHIVKGA